MDVVRRLLDDWPRQADARAALEQRLAAMSAELADLRRAEAAQRREQIERFQLGLAGLAALGLVMVGLMAWFIALYRDRGPGYLGAAVLVLAFFVTITAALVALIVIEERHRWELPGPR